MDKKLNKNFLIYSYSCEGTTGIDDELVSFLLEKDPLVSITHIKFPFISSKNGSIKLLEYRNGALIKKESFIKFYKPEILSYLKDLFCGLYYGIRYSSNSTQFIGNTNISAFVGVLLKFFGFTDKVFYWMIDYTPQRYKNSTLNSFYYMLDKFVCEHVTEVWPLNETMLKGREHDGHLDISKISYRVVPFGNNSHKRNNEDYQKGDPKKIVYFGVVTKNKGAELFVPVALELLNRGVKDFSFHIVGGGDLHYLKSEIAKHSLEKYFTLYGRIEDHAEVERILLTCGIALAPYYPDDKNSFSYYADPGKVKVYLGCGLPILITDVPPIAKKIQNEKAGLITAYDVNSYSDNIIYITKNVSYVNFRNNAIKLGHYYSWDKIFDKLFCEL